MASLPRFARARGGEGQSFVMTVGSSVAWITIEWDNRIVQLVKRHKESGKTITYHRLTTAFKSDASFSLEMTENHLSEIAITSYGNTSISDTLGSSPITGINALLLGILYERESRRISIIL